MGVIRVHFLEQLPGLLRNNLIPFVSDTLAVPEPVQQCQDLLPHKGHVTDSTSYPRHLARMRVQLASHPMVRTAALPEGEALEEFSVFFTAS